MESSFSETWVNLYQTTRRNIQDDSAFNIKNVEVAIKQFLFLI
jgi:hypothetical protein